MTPPRMSVLDLVDGLVDAVVDVLPVRDVQVYGVGDPLDPVRWPTPVVHMDMEDGTAWRLLILDATVS